MKTKTAVTCFIALMTVLPANEGAEKDPKSPKAMLNFTKGDQLPSSVSHDWTLGPIGARGWCQSGGSGAAGNTTNSRQILITRVDPQGPSAKTLRAGDVIVGIDQELFQSDARIAFARSIEPAESSNGILQLRIFREDAVQSNWT